MNPAEALDCFLRTRMDVLVLGDTMVSDNRPMLGEAVDQAVSG